MPTIEVIVRNNVHRLACNEGEEARLEYLVGKFNKHIEDLTIKFPSVEDRTLYLIIGLLLIDQLEEKQNTVTPSIEDTTTLIDSIANRLKSLLSSLE